MAYRPQVLLLGESVFMDSVAESLLECNTSNVVRISSRTQEARELVNSINPDLIVYELHTQNTDPIFAIIKEQTDTLHLVIDLDYNQIILLDCQRKPAESMQELCELINQEVNIKKEETNTQTQFHISTYSTTKR